jgi:molybdenum cofactor sulfurtransferase
MEGFASEMISTLYGNPHSASSSSVASTQQIEDIRLRALQFFNADPADFDLIFVANATAGIKLVAEAFRASPGGFEYKYHKDAHTSLIGVREEARIASCVTDEDISEWFAERCGASRSASCESTVLFAYPAQSNMNGRRLPLSWSASIRSRLPNMYTLLDAAALVSTAPLDLSDPSSAPDFTVCSFNKIFGFPDLGALIVCRKSADILRQRKYFGGGTVDTVVCLKEQWHAPKMQSLHEICEDGTLPMHSIMALDTAINVHKKLYESMEKVSRHTMFLAQRLYDGLKSLKHENGKDVCQIYAEDEAYTSGHQGSVIAFNLRTSLGAWHSNTEVEKLAAIRKIHFRTGGVCNPGGIATALDLAPWEIRRNFSAGFRCGTDNDVMAGKPTGVIRLSLGAMSTLSDVERFLEFVREFYVETAVVDTIGIRENSSVTNYAELYVESLTIYPVKSCGGYSIPEGIDWEVRPEGLAWDREWCLVHAGTGQALSQKQYPRMALIRPAIDFDAGVLFVRFGDDSISVPLSANPALFKQVKTLEARVCGDTVRTRKYADQSINDFFSRALAVPCALARFPAGGSGPSTRHAKAHMQVHQLPNTRLKAASKEPMLPCSFPDPPSTPPDSDTEIATAPRPILLSNESPILLLNRASLTQLNHDIASHTRRLGKPAPAAVFRGNILVSPLNPCSASSSDSQPSPAPAHQPYAEDSWRHISIGTLEFDMLGSCRRCHMVCIDQETGEKDAEPFGTLAKTRRMEGKVWFGSHMCLAGRGGDEGEMEGRGNGVRRRTVRVGDVVEVLA